MTQNQIAFYNAREGQRHNYATETETNRSNRANEAETKRSNLARETETNRHNIITEGQTDRSLKETERSNRAKEFETNRSNTARELETNRSNLANEDIAKQKNIITQGYNAGSLSELIRHNQEEEQMRRNAYALDLQQYHEQQAVNTSTIEKNKAQTAYANEQARWAETYARAEAAKAATSSAEKAVNIFSTIGGWIAGLGG